MVVPNGAVAQGQLERAGDVDYFKVVLEANATYTFLLGNGAGLGAAVLGLRAEDGRVLSSASGTKNGSVPGQL